MDRKAQCEKNKGKKKGVESELEQENGKHKEEKPKKAGKEAKWKTGRKKENRKWRGRKKQHETRSEEQSELMYAWATA